MFDDKIVIIRKMGCLKLLLYLYLLYAGSAQENNDSSLKQSDIFDDNFDQHVSKDQLLFDHPYENNTKPMFKDCAKYNPAIEEGRDRGTFVIRVHAEDPDPPDKNSGNVTYSIEQLAGTRPSFIINATTGDVYTNEHFDRDEPSRQKELYVTVRAFDHGRPPLADICTFKVTVTDINDNVPSFDQLEFSAQVSEDLKKDSEVTRVIAYDFDDGENSRLTYSLAPGSNFNEYFRIDNKTGVVYLKKELNKGQRGTKFVSSVEVQDNGEKPNKAHAEISVMVIDSGKKSPTFTEYQSNRTLPEDYNDYEGPLFTLTAESNILDKSVAFELVKGKTIQTNKDQTFTLSPTGDNSAIITLARHLDYETVTEYQLTVRASNKDMLYASININVYVKDVNDEIPTFIELLKGSVVENDVIGARAMTVRAIDKDGTSPNNEVTYELISHRDKFTIDPKSGVITSLVHFDREEEALYYVTVQARDNAPSALFRDKLKPNSANQTFQISIEDQNDNIPKFTESIYNVFNVSESTDKQKVVIEVKAKDEDTASVIKYSIIEGNVGNAFNIEQSTGRIRVNNQLDYEKIESYNLTVMAHDGLFNDTAKVVINIQNENDEVPVFQPYDKDIHCTEEEVSSDCIIVLKAYDPDIKDRNADQKIVYQVADDYKSFLSVTNDGCVMLIKKLDRDYPNGAPSYQAYIRANDNNGGPNSLKSHAELNIILDDINDNAPILNMTEVVWYENQEPGIITVLTAIDYDSPQNGPPYTFEISESAPTVIKESFSIDSKNLRALTKFDRESQKFYDVSITITDSGQPPLSGTSNLRVIIGDENDNEAKNGSSEIFVYKYERLETDIEIGRVYVDDPDDWDLPDKVFQQLPSSNGFLDENFELHDHGMIVMKKTAEPKQYKLSFLVTEEHEPLIPKHEVYADVTITVKTIPEEAVRKSGSIRLNGTTIEHFVEKDSYVSSSKKDILQKHLSKILNTSLDNVDIFTVLPANNSLVDVRFSAHGSPYYAPEKLNNKATEHQTDLEKELGVEFVMININECLQSTVCSANSSCTNELNIENEPAVVFTNKTSFVGVKAVVKPVCECKPHYVGECFNGGTMIGNDLCSCPEGFVGPHCENPGISFAGDGWAMYRTFDSCISTVISLHVLSQSDNGLIFYAGPVTERHARLSKDFIALELRDGYLVFKIDLGYGSEEIVSRYKKISDGAMHRIRINYTTVDVQIEVDECPSDCLILQNFAHGGLLNVNGPLQVGGRSNLFSDEASKQTWVNPPTTVGFTGCITNFTYNSFMYNLGAPSDSYHARASCFNGISAAVTFGIDSNFLVAILVCIAILFILMLAVVVHKRKQDNSHEKEMDDTRENIINYEDEGGGECDANVDMTVFRDLYEKPPMKDSLYKQGNDVPADIGSFLDDKKRACDKDNLPCDDVRHYGYEGDGNSSGSLSSLASCTDEGDLKFNYLSSFGPRFRKLADMYGDDGSEEGSQNGGEESWC